MFKKTNIKKKPSIIINFIGLLSILIILVTWFTIISNVDFIKLDILKQTNWKNPFVNSNIEEIEQTNKVNILLAWRWGWTHDAPNLTDTLILANIDFDTNIISMLSIPRDLYVEYNDWSSWKINKIYAQTAYKTKSKKTWMNILSKKIEEVTKQKIDYYINIDFNWFKKLIDTIWWIELTIPEQFVDTQYPDWNWGYKTIVFKKWTWLFDWENALKYARSRHSTSDFDRSLRQQQIINWVRNKLTAWYLLSSPLKIKDLYNVFIEFINTDIELQEILKLAIKLKTRDFKLQSFNLNDSCFYWSNTCSKWWLLYIPSRDFFGWASVLLPDWADVNNLNNFNVIHRYTNLIFNNSDLFKENYKINIFNSLKTNFLASLLADEVKKYWLNIPEVNSIWNTKKIYEKSIIYYNDIENNSKTILAILDFFPWINIEKIESPMYSKDQDTKIEIIIWKDYENIFKNVY